MSYGPPPEPEQGQYGQPTTRFEPVPGAGAAPGLPDSPVAPPPGYPPPAGRYGLIANAYGEPIGSGATFGVVGATLAGVGAVALIIAFTALDWFRNFRGPSHLRDIHALLAGRGPNSAALPKAWFGWLAWLMFVVVVVLAIAATLPSPASGPLRALGAVTAVAGIALACFAIRLSDVTAYTFYIKHASIGFYFCLAGFALAGVGALTGPSRH